MGAKTQSAKSATIKNVIVAVNAIQAILNFVEN
jgi:hypothetical protein